MKDRASGVYWKTVDLVWSGCVHRVGRGFRRCDRERGQSRLSTVSPIVPARPARVHGPGGRVQAPQSYVTPGLAVGLGSTQPGGIITALDAGMNWARDKSLFDLAFRG